MGTIAEKLQYTVDAIDGIEVALQGKGVETTNKALAEYPALIDSIPTGATVDREGLAALGYNDEEIEQFQKLGAFLPVPDWNIAEAGKLAYQVRKDVVYLPKSADGSASTQAAYRSFASVTAVIIPDGAPYIGQYAFQHCYSLSAVSIPSSITMILSDAFQNCRSLRLLDLSKITEVISLSSTNALGNTHSELKILVPMDLLSAYKRATNWSAYSAKFIGV